MTIYRKLIAGFGVVILLMAAVMAYLLSELYQVSRASEEAFAADVRAIDVAKRLDALVFDQEVYVRKYLVVNDEAYYRKFAEGTSDIAALSDSLLFARPDSVEIAAIRDLRRQQSSIVRLLEEHRRSTARSRGQRGQSPPIEATLTLMDSIRESLQSVVGRNQTTVGISMEEVRSSTSRALKAALLATIGGVLAAVLTALVITRGITRPIQVLARGTDQVARGSFDPLPVTAEGEIADLTRAFNEMSDRLRKVNEAKAEMMQRISHELRTPLQAMLSAHYLLTEQRLGPLNADQVRLLGSIRDSIEKLSKFSNQFLDLAKIEAGMMEFRLERTDLLALVRTVVSEAELVAGEKGIGLDLTSTGNPAVMADPEKLAQVVSNLVGNAIKYTGAGGSVVINVSPCEKGVRLAVQDSGMGIAPEDLPHVFTKFYRARNAVAGAAKGTGLGLALVKAVVEEHGGTVAASSVQGDGSTFTVELPEAPPESNKPIRQKEQADA
jgi:signal transduction histidine kinase